MILHIVMHMQQSSLVYSFFPFSLDRMQTTAVLHDRQKIIIVISCFEEMGL